MTEVYKTFKTVDGASLFHLLRSVRKKSESPMVYINLMLLCTMYFLGLVLNDRLFNVIKYSVAIYAGYDK
jgi:hypothetical protein